MGCLRAGPYPVVPQISCVPHPCSQSGGCPPALEDSGRRLLRSGPVRASSRTPLSARKWTEGERPGQPKFHSVQRAPPGPGCGRRTGHRADEGWEGALFVNLRRGCHMHRDHPKGTLVIRFRDPKGSARGRELGVSWPGRRGARGPSVSRRSRAPGTAGWAAGGGRPEPRAGAPSAFSAGGVEAAGLVGTTPDPWPGAEGLPPRGGLLQACSHFCANLFSV